jgi:NADH-quinone oxidoreductase subunit C
MMTEALNDLSTYIREARPSLVEDAVFAYDELTLVTNAESIIELLTFLRDDARCGFVSFIDICGVDYPARAKRFDVVYHLLSPKQNLRIRIKLATTEDEAVPSAFPIFEGHPLRKDFPTTGFVEVRYDDSVKRVVYEPVELRQEFRNFDFMSPWEGTDYVLPGDEKAKT